MLHPKAYPKLLILTDLRKIVIIEGKSPHRGPVGSWVKRRRMDNMDSHTAQVQELFLNPLRVLAEYDTTYKTHVAYCLETGSVVTAETADDLKTMMKELLEDEISFAIANKNLTNLFSTPASFDVFLKWQEAAKNGVEDITLDIENPIRPKGPEGAKRQSSFIARVTHVAA